MIACLQGITIIVLQATIAYHNTAQVNRGLESDAIQSYDLNGAEQEAITDAIERLRRIKWENIAFIGFQFWFVGMSLDAVSRSTLRYRFEPDMFPTSRQSIRTLQKSLHSLS